jgi:DNA-3-methyladenine glycosylase I
MRYVSHLKRRVGHTLPDRPRPSRYADGFQEKIIKDAIKPKGILMKNEHRAPWDCIYAKEDKSDCKPGKKPRSDQKYFEILCLCLLQAGLNWGLIRKNWQKYREGFLGFDIHRLSKAQTRELFKDTRVIKNRKKVEAIVHNAKEFLWIRREYGSFANFLRSLKQRTDEELFKLLMKRFKHIGSYTIEYYLHSVGY